VVPKVNKESTRQGEKEKDEEWEEWPSRPIRKRGKIIGFSQNKKSTNLSASQTGNPSESRAKKERERRKKRKNRHFRKIHSSFNKFETNNGSTRKE